jgi:hypothetical protein
MNRDRDPYNKGEIVDACARHAWERRAEEFRRRGIRSEGELRNEIERVMEHAETRAFRAQTQEHRGHTFGREIYDLRPYNESSKGYGITLVLNPNRNPETGQLYDSTCYIRRKDDFQSRVRREVRDAGVRPEIVIGGRPALREQDRHRQLVVTPGEQQAVPHTAAEQTLDVRRYQDKANHGRQPEQIAAKERTPAAERVKQSAERKHEAPDPSIARTKSNEIER